ncbi:MAG: hypothetical protein JW982_12655 [Spirochaetes bacterium]|nr:hypothetical protein [Spirochaetota bacterium]
MNEMNENLKKVIYLFGIIAIVFLLIRYLLPVVIKILGFFVAIFIYVFLIALAVVIVLYLIGYSLRKMNGD